MKNSSGYDTFVVHNRPFSVSLTLNNDATAGRQSSSYSPRIGAKKGALVHICIWKKKTKKVTGAGVPLGWHFCSSQKAIDRLLSDRNSKPIWWTRQIIIFATWPIRGRENPKLSFVILGSLQFCNSISDLQTAIPAYYKPAGSNPIFAPTCWSHFRHCVPPLTMTNVTWWACARVAAESELTARPRARSQLPFGHKSY